MKSGGMLLGYSLIITKCSKYYQACKMNAAYNSTKKVGWSGFTLGWS